MRQEIINNIALWITASGQIDEITAMDEYSRDPWGIAHELADDIRHGLWRPAGGFDIGDCREALDAWYVQATEDNF